jgi:hypothetical protein
LYNETKTNYLFTITARQTVLNTLKQALGQLGWFLGWFLGLVSVRDCFLKSMVFCIGKSIEQKACFSIKMLYEHDQVD